MGMKRAHKTEKEPAARAAAGDDAGNEAEQEEVGSSEPLPVTGKRLIDLTRQRLAELNKPERAILDIIGVTYVYWNALTNGHRRLSGLPHAKMQRLADFLEIPVIQAYMLADLYTPADLVVHKDLADHLKGSLAKMRADKRWNFIAPPDEAWDATPEASQLAIILLYERVAGQALLTRALWEAGIGSEPRDPNFVLTL